VQTLGKQSGTGHHRCDVRERVGVEAQPEELVIGKNTVLQDQSRHQKVVASHSESVGMTPVDLARQP